MPAAKPNRRVRIVSKAPRKMNRAKKPGYGVADEGRRQSDFVAAEVLFGQVLRRVHLRPEEFLV